MDDPFATNRAFWDEAVGIHVRSVGPTGYNMEEFKRGKNSLHPIEVREVGDVKGKDLLHLQCHFGQDTVSWARLGARVTGADFSQRGIEEARALAGELGVDARFILSNIYDLPGKLTDRFDVVFTSIGVLNWLPDLARWAGIIAHFLRPRGFFYMVEGHPFAAPFSDKEGVTELKLEAPYFPAAGPMRLEGHEDYADPAARYHNTVTYEWDHPMGEIVTSLAEAGLRIDFLHEFPFIAWRSLPFLELRGDEYFHPPEGMPKFPLMFSIRATKPRR